jgi:hypothetical protein
MAYCGLKDMRYALTLFCSVNWHQRMTRNLNSFLYLSAGILILLLCGHAWASDSQDYVEIAKSRLAQMDEKDMRGTWFFTITTRTEEEVLVVRNDPTREDSQRRQLVSVNGEVPTAERLEEFEEQQAKRNKDEDGENSRNSLSEMVDFSTLTLVEISEGQAVLAYTPVLDGLEKASDKLEGTLKLNADTHLVEELSLVNTEKLSPAFSVSLTTFNMKFLFSPVDGETLLSGMETSIEGKAGFLKKFKENTEIVFSDYRRMSELQAKAY